MRIDDSPEQLRNAFLAFAGPERFRKFVLQLRADTPQPSEFGPYPGHNALRFWQEQMWDAFRSQHPEASIDLPAIRTALLWCDVHDCALSVGRAIGDLRGVSDRDGNIVDPEFDAVLVAQFPYGFGSWRIVCPACVVACQQWSDRPNPDG